MSISLTPNQARLLAVIKTEIARTGGVAPTLREMCAALGFKSPGHATRVLGMLEERGHIRRVPYRARAIEILEASDDAPSAARRALDSIGAPATEANIRRIAQALDACRIGRAP